MFFLQVFVMDLNYVKHNDQKQTSHKHEVLVQKELTGPTFGKFIILLICSSAYKLLRNMFRHTIFYIS